MLQSWCNFSTTKGDHLDPIHSKHIETSEDIQKMLILYKKMRNQKWHIKNVSQQSQLFLNNKSEHV